MSAKILGVIPCRYESSRLPGKPLVKIKGIELIKRTYKQCIKSKVFDDLVVATDDIRIEKFCQREGMNVIMTSKECLTGTDRVAEVAEKMDYDLYINIQGDEPVIDPKSFDCIVEAYKQFGDKYIAYNGYKKITIEEEIPSWTIPKVIFNEQEELMYMSRLPVPYNKGKVSRDYFKQVCVYGFTKKALKVFTQQGKTINEKHEDIEILRFVDLGHKVKMVRVEYDCIAVDVPEDILKVEKYLLDNNLD